MRRATSLDPAERSDEEVVGVTVELGHASKGGAASFACDVGQLRAVASSASKDNTQSRAHRGTAPQQPPNAQVAHVGEIDEGVALESAACRAARRRSPPGCRGSDRSRDRSCR